jgi:hypothetical protein
MSAATETMPTGTAIADAVVSICMGNFSFAKSAPVKVELREDEMDAQIIASRRSEPMEDLDSIVDELGLNE